jgi:hypothetical protein
MAANRLHTHFWRLLLAACLASMSLSASESHGIVKSGTLPVPGATVTATQGDKKVVTTTDDTGYYSFPELADGVWTIGVEALGFVPATREIGVAEGMPGPDWDLKYQTLDAIANPPKPEAPPVTPATATAAPNTPATATATAPADTKTATPATPATPAAATPSTAAATPPAKGKKGAAPASNANTSGRPSLNAALAGGQAGGFTRLNVGQTGDALGAQDNLAQQQDMGDMAAAGNDSFTINGSVSSGLGMAQPGGDWMAGGRGGPGGFGQDMGGGMGPGGVPGMNGGDPNGQPGGGPGGPGGGGPGGGGGRGGGGGGGARGGGGGMMAGIPNIGGGGRGGGGRGGRGGPGGRNPGAFGNNRRDPRSRYNFAASLNNFTNAVLDARQYSVTGAELPKPNSQTIRSTLTAGGPLKIPHIFDTKGKGTFTINYSLTRNRNALTFSDLVPTDAEKAGNFAGFPQLYNGSTPYPNNVIPVSPVAQALEKYYPEPNVFGAGSTAFNYAASASGHTNGDNINARLSYTFNTKNQVNGGIQWQRQNTSTPSVFSGAIPGWNDISTNNGVNANASYIYHFNLHVISTLRYNYSRASALSTPYFSNLTNVEGNLGIQGTDQYPVNWGPPALSFTGSSTLGLSDATLRFSHPQTSAIGDTVLWVKGVHEFQFGGDFSRRETNLLSQSNPRGTFQFTGAETALNGDTKTSGYAFADFLLGVPYSMSINYTNSLSGAQGAQLLQNPTDASLLAIQNTPSGGDRYLRTNVYDLFATDQWRLTPRISLSIGLRWDYQAPSTELYGRLATLDLPGNFQVPNSIPASELPVVAGQTGVATGIHYSDSMLNGQKTDISPRVGMAWKPWSKHSTVIRGGIGMYYVPSVYSNLVSQLDAQTPFATAFNIQNSCGATLQTAFLVQTNGCLPGGIGTTTTNAINPDFRVGYTSNWQFYVQQNLLANTVASVTYFGSKGTALTQQLYPNTSPTPADQKSAYVAPCTAGFYCPVGYLYETSNGNSIDNGLQLQLQRRLRSGFGGTVSYTLNHAIDDAPSGNATQNWQDLAAERARSAGIRAQTLNLQLQYSSGVSARGGGLVSGWQGVLFRDWTVMPGLIVASGAPITINASQLALGGAPNGNIRVNYVGGPTYINGILNPAAFADPVGYGNLGRDSLTGPMQFTTSLNALRTFRLADRKNVTFSVNVINPLNHPNVSNWNTNWLPPSTGSLVNSNAQFGLPQSYVSQRQITANLRFNF